MRPPGSGSQGWEGGPPCRVGVKPPSFPGGLLHTAPPTPASPVRPQRETGRLPWALLSDGRWEHLCPRPTLVLPARSSSVEQSESQSQSKVKG